MRFTHFVYCLSQVLTSGEGNQEWRAEEKAREYHLLPADQLLGGWGLGGGCGLYHIWCNSYPKVDGLGVLC